MTTILILRRPRTGSAFILFILFLLSPPQRPDGSIIRLAFIRRTLTADGAFIVVSSVLGRRPGGRFASLPSCYVSPASLTTPSSSAHFIMSLRRSFPSRRTGVASNYIFSLRRPNERAVLVFFFSSVPPGRRAGASYSSLCCAAPTVGGALSLKLVYPVPAARRECHHEFSCCAALTVGGSVSLDSFVPLVAAGRVRNLANRLLVSSRRRTTPSLVPLIVPH